MKRTLLFQPDGTVLSVYFDELQTLDLGPHKMTRASLVEFDETSQEWVAYRVDENLKRRGVLAHGPSRSSVEQTEREVLEAELARSQ